MQMGEVRFQSTTVLFNRPTEDFSHLGISLLIKQNGVRQKRGDPMTQLLPFLPHRRLACQDPKDPADAEPEACNGHSWQAPSQEHTEATGHCEGEGEGEVMTLQQRETTLHVSQIPQLR